MGCGKSSVGRKLAALLRDMRAAGTAESRVCHIDLDDYIIERRGKSISDIFAESGEDGFRAVETECLLEVLDWADGRSACCGPVPQQVPDVLVLSLGGGAVLRNSELLHARTFCIYLKASIDTLVSRLSGHAAKRPLLASETEDTLRARVESILNDRKELYESTAHMTYVTEGMSVYAVASGIIERINKR